LQLGGGVAPCERKSSLPSFLERTQNCRPLVRRRVPASLAYGGGKLPHDLGRASGDLPVQLLRHAGEHDADRLFAIG
jgi:hypothetical protein